MPRQLIIRNLIIRTGTGEFDYPFGPGLNVISGPVGTGKSSLMEMIKFGLGGNAVRSHAVTEAVKEVSVRLTLGERTAMFTRALGRNVVHCAIGENTETLSTRASADRRSTSSFMLEALSIPEIRLPRSLQHPTSASVPLTFWDVYKYLYVPQTEIDRSVIWHADPILSLKRKPTFEVLFGLMSAAKLELQVNLGQVTDQLAEARRRELTISDFLRTTGEPSESGLGEGHSRALSMLADAQHELTVLREDLRNATAQEAASRQHLVDLAAQLLHLQQREAELVAERTERDRLSAQLELEAQRASRTVAARTRISGLEFVTCPRCLQSIGEDRGGDEICRLCLQHVAGTRTPGNSLADQPQEASAIAAVTSEINELNRATDTALDDVQTQQRGLETELASFEAQIETRTKSYVSPRFEAISAVSTRVAAAEERLRAVSTAQDYWSRFREVQAATDALSSEQERITAAIANESERLEAGRPDLDQLSAIFDEQVRLLGVPWYEEKAWIDSRDYLPYIDGIDFQTLSSGGIKTLVNVAYHLALLSFSLRTGAYLMPNLLILDGLRKNVGADEDDRELSQRLYGRLRTLEDVYADGFQVIAADNDVPTGIKLRNHIELSYEKPLIPDLAHPGGDVETIG